MDDGGCGTEPQGAEHRLGRPQVVRRAGQYLMFFGYGSEERPYQLGLARSATGVEWSRDDASLGLSASDAGWDSQMAAYPGIAQVDGRLLLFYNGNDYGHEGFACAELVELP